MADDGQSARTTAVVILATLAVIATLYVGAEFLVPIAFALVLDVLFRPAVRAMKRLHVPVPLGAGVIVLALFAGMIGAGFAIAAPLRAWIAKAPQNLAAAQ